MNALTHIRPLLSIVAIVGSLLALLPMSSGPASAQIVPTQALFMSATIVSEPSGLVAVHGEGFTPGGLVYIAITGNDGKQVFHDGWTVASTGVYGPNGSIDPANGYIPAGSIVEVISLGTGIVYGPIGSQDRTQTYIPGADDAWRTAICSRTLDVQAYDAESLTWSERLDLVTGDAPCLSLADESSTADELPPASLFPNGRGRSY